MSTGRLFWGSFFLSTGVLLVLDKLQVFCIQLPWVWNFWPIVVVLLGLAMILGRRSLKLVTASAAGVLLGILVAGLISTNWFDGGGSGETVAQKFQRPLDAGIRVARLSLDAGAGSYSIGDTSASLIDATVSTSIGPYEFHSETADSIADIRVWLQGQRSGWHWSRWENRVTFALSPRPEWELDLDVGAAKVDFDLRPFAVRRIRMDAGAASIVLQLGGRLQEVDVDIDAGASSIRLEVPDSVGCEIFAEAPLSSKRFPGFSRIGEGRYQSDNFEGAKNRITIRLDAGVSSLKVKRVSTI